MMKISTFPAKQHTQNYQLSLFQKFLCNSEDERQKLSNSIELWDSVPRYSISQVAMNEMRDKNGMLGLLKLEYWHRSTKFNILIQPALIEEIVVADGTPMLKTISYYPSANEELVEEALRKLAIDQNCGFYNKAETFSGVTFSMYQLREELKRSVLARV